MKLICIYGLPATGKLTVAKELSELTGYRIFHNHLTADLVYSIFPFGTKLYADLVAKVRLDLIEVAAKNNARGIIFTFVYGMETHDGKADYRFVKNVINRVKKHNGQVLFVKLTCEEKELRNRLKHPSRKSFKKLHKIKDLQSVRKKYDLNAVVPFGKTQIIDNTELSARKVAFMIKRHYKLA